MFSSAQLWQAKGRFPVTPLCELLYWMVRLSVCLYTLDLLFIWGAHPGLSVVATLVAMVATRLLVPWQVWVRAAAESVRRAQARSLYRPGPSSWIWALLIASTLIWFCVDSPMATTVVVVACGLVSWLLTRRPREGRR